MKLTLHTEYALRMLIFLASDRGRPVTVSDVAEAYGISRNHLLKVALNLGRHGYVRTARGRAGGISLALPPDRINLGAVIRRMQDGLAPVACTGSECGACALSPVCRLRSVMRQAIEAFLAVFDAHTLADLVNDRPLLDELLGVTTEPARAA